MDSGMMLIAPALNPVLKVSDEAENRIHLVRTISRKINTSIAIIRNLHLGFVVLDGSLIITIMKPENMERILYLINPKITSEQDKEILGEAEYFKHSWKIGIVFVDFIGQNGYNLAEKQQILKDYEKFTLVTRIEVIPIDSLEDMFIILSSLLESIGKTL